MDNIKEIEDKKKRAVDILFANNPFKITREQYEKYKNFKNIAGLADLTMEQRLEIVEIRTIEKNLEALERLA